MEGAEHRRPRAQRADRAGIAYFVVAPSGVSGTVAAQGYVSVNRNSVMYPSIAVAPGGTKAAMVFTLAGPDFYPSTAFVRLSPGGAVTTPVTVSAAGTAPADGFTGYPAFDGNGVERWGDYSAAVSDAAGRSGWRRSTSGHLRLPRVIANWGTAVSAL